MAMGVTQSGSCCSTSGMAISNLFAGQLMSDCPKSACSLSRNPLPTFDSLNGSSSSSSCINIGRHSVIGFGSTRTRGGAVVVCASRGGNKPGDKESKAAYDAFFLGKSFAEVVNERLGSAFGEFLSEVGQRQAEQMKKIRELQDEVKSRAAAAAVKAARKALAEEKEKEKENTLASSKSPSQPPPSTSGLSNPEQL